MELQDKVAIAQRRVVHDRSTYREIDTSVIDLLLGYNASVNELDEVRYSKGVSALQIACVQGRTEILELLLNENPENQTKNVEIGRISTDVATLTHPLIKLGILQNEDDVNSHQNRRHRFPGFDSLNIPANMAIMEVLIRNGATFNFPTGRSRDSQLRHVILALSWQNHTYEALRLTLLLLFSPWVVEVKQHKSRDLEQSEHEHRHNSSTHVCRRHVGHFGMVFCTRKIRGRDYCDRSRRGRTLHTGGHVDSVKEIYRENYSFREDKSS
ncbi:uncharacterized protein PITG_15286 [Phytophthora infestans T30-4]|uniref:Uncharacterized protein n=1 Tax=Phytophthora infestans (strain T30-4) TaxID=403677 RepID=D0NQC2_PHYIT|nr:uncharacterized protein PITG_15286 [Phytophthora infestans T30-4]EEY62854.1 conserved hypothetical protein [Phytophthora infestans T30-4]|eukprot:XP_002898729.1 conserved hypothetical protein [Phytophthora infestans T30-4]